MFGVPECVALTCVCAYTGEPAAVGAAGLHIYEDEVGHHGASAGM